MGKETRTGKGSGWHLPDQIGRTISEGIREAQESGEPLFEGGHH